MRVLLIRLEAPLMAFGREAIDQNGPTRDHPDISLLTGLFANALGWRREEAERHQRLQDRLCFAVRLDREGRELRDFQTVKLAKNDASWTTRGNPEGRAGGAGTYESPHIRFRFYRADAALTVAIALAPADETPTVQDIAEALAEPARPLFIGRKPCLPAAPLCRGVVEAGSLIAALRCAQPSEAAASYRHVLSPDDAAGMARAETIFLTGRRDWVAGVHAGQEQRVVVSLAFAREAIS